MQVSVCKEATDALNALGEIYAKQVLASGVIPQITAVFGTCGGGMALMPALTDFTFMESKNAKLFVQILRTHWKETEVSNAIPHPQNSRVRDAGLVDFTGSEDEVLSGIRKLVTLLPANNEEDAVDDCSDDLNRVCADLANAAGDTAILLSNIADDQDFVETKRTMQKRW